MIGEGHVTPMMHLCGSLAESGHSVTFAIMDDDKLPRAPYSQIKRKGTWPPTGLDISLEKIKTKAVPEIGESSSIADFHIYTTTYQEDFEELVTRIRASRGACTVISDYLLGWCMDTAIKLDIPGSVLFTGSITWSWFEYKMSEIVSSGLVPTQKQGEELTEKENSVVLNNVYELRRSDIPWHFWDCKSLQDFTIERLSRTVFGKAHRVLVNSCSELENEMLRCMVDELGSEKLIPVGPLFLRSSGATKPSSTGLTKCNTDCLRWLDQQEPSSVLYIAFGSIADLSQEQREEFAKGLEQSQKKFLWVIRTGGTEVETFVGDFSERTKDQGLVVAWAPQTEVLSHKSVAAFISHCGWNSTTESIACGKPILCLPLLYDQNTNARLITDLWKAGVRFTRNTRGIAESAEIDRVIRAALEPDHEIHAAARRLALQFQETPRRTLTP